MTAIDRLGYAAVVLTTLSFVPQAVLTLRTRHVAGISLGEDAAFTAGVALWLLYGCTLGQRPIVAAHAQTQTQTQTLELALALALASVILKIAVEQAARLDTAQARPGR